MKRDCTLTLIRRAALDVLERRPPLVWRAWAANLLRGRLAAQQIDNIEEVQRCMPGRDEADPSAIAAGYVLTAARLFGRLQGRHAMRPDDVYILDTSARMAAVRASRLARACVRADMAPMADALLPQLLESKR